MANFLNFRRMLKNVLLEQVGLQERFLVYPYHFVCHEAIQSRGSEKGLIRNVGCPRAASCVRIVKVRLTRNSLCPVDLI